MANWAIVARIVAELWQILQLEMGSSSLVALAIILFSILKKSSVLEIFYEPGRGVLPVRLDIRSL